MKGKKYARKTQALHQEFLLKFPLERLQKMELEQYALGLQPQGSLL
ncbi:hypothetical protein [Lysinibacillus sphaericus]|nr:hypothetical protein [Lysinibacillus sphaericus]